MKRLCTIVCFSLILTGVSPGAEEGQQPRTAVKPTLQTRNPRYALRVGDVFEIGFRFTSEYNQTVTVQPDGYISLRDLPDLLVAGKTAPEVKEMVAQAYSQILHEPVVSVQVKDFEKPSFVAGGEVARPGKYEMRSPTKVTEAIAVAGGFSDKAKHSQVLLFRKVSDDWTEVKKLNMKAMLNAADLTEDPQLRPGDMIYVPKNFISKIERFIPTVNLSPYLR